VSSHEDEIPKPVQNAFERIPEPMRDRLLVLRALVLEAGGDPRIDGGIEETLKWGQPSYLPRAPGIGTTVRLGTSKAWPDHAALFFHCQTRLLDTFRHLYPDTFDFEGDRALLILENEPIPKDAVRHCAALALTYHQWKNSRP